MKHSKFAHRLRMQQKRAMRKRMATNWVRIGGTFYRRIIYADYKLANYELSDNKGNTFTPSPDGQFLIIAAYR